MFSLKKHYFKILFSRPNFISPKTFFLACFTKKLFSPRNIVHYKQVSPNTFFPKKIISITNFLNHKLKKKHVFTTTTKITYILTKLQKQQNPKTQIATKFQNSNCGRIQSQILTKFKLKLRPNSKPQNMITQLLTKL